MSIANAMLKAQLFPGLMKIAKRLGKTPTQQQINTFWSANIATLETYDENTLFDRIVVLWKTYVLNL